VSSPQHLLRVTRGFTLFFGLVQVLVAFGGPLLDQTVVEAVLTIAGFTTGITLGVFFLGIFTRRVGQRAALAGLVLGLATISAVAFGTQLAWPWYTLVGSLSTFGFGLGASLVWPAAPRPDATPTAAPHRRRRAARACCRSRLWSPPAAGQTGTTPTAPGWRHSHAATTPGRPRRCSARSGCARPAATSSPTAPTSSRATSPTCA
jgi:hypothetical protein